MDTKRWFALLGAAVLFIVSIIAQIGANAATTKWEDVFELNEFSEKVVEEGSGGQKIVVANLEGVIQDMGDNPFLSSGLNNYNRLLKVLDHAAEDDSVDGVIINVDSPGGGVVESATIHDKVIEIQEEHDKPVYVTMGNTADSGGYYVAAPADKIVAHPATITGSIGVIMQAIDFTDLADDLGIDFNTIKSGKHKDIMSSSRKMTDEEKDILQSIIDESYDEFVQIIVDGRDMSESEVRRLADGRVYTGKQAQENELVDELGSLEDTIAMMEEDYGWDDSLVVEYEPGFAFDSFLGMRAKSIFGEDQDLFRIQDLIRESNAPRAMYLYSE